MVSLPHRHTGAYNEVGDLTRDMTGNRLCTRYLLETDAIALGGGLSDADPGAAPADTPGAIIPVDTSGIVPAEPLLSTVHLYTRRYTGDGHVIRTEAADAGGEAAVGTGFIESIQFEGGYFDRYGKANYYVADYLGNVIAVVDEAGHLVQATDYYPYGLPFRMPADDSTPNRHLFGGKEFLSEDGLNEYCQGARQYVPRIPRFDRIDDLAEKHPDHSPYLPFAANPIAFIDPTGCDTIYAVDKSGSLDAINTTGKEDPNKYIVSGKTKDRLKKEESPGPMENGPEVAVIVSGISEFIKNDVERSKELQIETGGHVNDMGHTQWVDGPEFNPESNIQSIGMFKSAKSSNGRVPFITVYWHVHPAVGGYEGSGRAIPSPKDRDMDAQNRDLHSLKGTAIVIGIRDSKATFYYKNTDIATIRLKDLYRLTK